MIDRTNELERFKTEINLSELMASFGYDLDRKASSKNSATMEHADGDKLIVSRGPDGHWVYFSVRDPGDSGTAIDFVQRRTGEHLGDVRRRLREWVPGADPPTALPTARVRPAPDRFSPELVPVARDIAQVRARFAAMRPIDAIGLPTEVTPGAYKVRRPMAKAYRAASKH